ncbi:hypothetical protein EDD15DRAFT_2162778, partial [Pisolithus albus]
VSRRVRAWSDLPAQRKNPRPSFQLSWEAEVVEYVNFLWQKTRSRKKMADKPAAISWDVPFLGPRFLPPTYLHAHRRPGLSSVMPDEQYLKPINVLHPLYYPQLTCCPRIRKNILTGSHPHKVHSDPCCGINHHCGTPDFVCEFRLLT